MTSSERAMDLPAYLARVGYEGPLAVDVPTLRGVHLAHATAIPFENLDIQMGLPIRLDLESLEDKLVGRRRGGYCFEHNTLFMHVLRAIGFEPIPCEARVRAGATAIRPRTHMVLVVRLDGAGWLADVGFGADGPLEPIAMDEEEHVQNGRTYRLAHEDGGRVLQLHRGEAWEDQYAFVPEARHPIDFEMANWFTSTHPSSGFVTRLTAQRQTAEATHVLRDLTYTVTDGDRVEDRELARDEVVPLLRTAFGIEVPADARFAALDGA
ncbi:MAG: arylamine N-acetyltransferase [Actinobacteria bacterium]|nr:arylamine N-acetyltransferase [Actinomycetota bacterium]